MADYQLRVINEKNDLDYKIHKLYEFLQNGRDAIPHMDTDEYARLLTQYRIMQIYSQILGERIAHFPPLKEGETK